MSWSNGPKGGKWKPDALPNAAAPAGLSIDTPELRDLIGDVYRAGSHNESIEKAENALIAYLAATQQAEPVAQQPTDAQIIAAFWAQTGRCWMPDAETLADRAKNFGYLFTYGQIVDATRALAQQAMPATQQGDERVIGGQRWSKETEMLESWSHLAATQQAEPAAWAYECRQTADPEVWAEFISRTEPWADRWTRNIQPLYAAPVSRASPAATEASGAAVPEGYVLVPREPTPEMIEAFGGQLDGACGSYFDWECNGDLAYAALIAAAPAAPEPTRTDTTEQLAGAVWNGPNTASQVHPSMARPHIPTPKE